MEEPLRLAAQQALRSREVVITDLCCQTGTNAVRLGLLIPFVVRREGECRHRPRRRSRSLSHRSQRGRFGASGQRPGVPLSFPRILAHPEPHRRETFLVRRDKDDWLCLSPLRHQAKAPFTLRLPASQAPWPALLKGLSTAGPTAGIDYRGVPVLTMAHSVPETPGCWWPRLIARKPRRLAPIRPHGLERARSPGGRFRPGRRLALAPPGSRLAAATAPNRRRTARPGPSGVQHLMRNANDIILLIDQGTADCRGQ